MKTTYGWWHSQFWAPNQPSHVRCQCHTLSMHCRRFNGCKWMFVHLVRYLLLRQTWLSTSCGQHAVIKPLPNPHVVVILLGNGTSNISASAASGSPKITRTSDAFQGDHQDPTTGTSICMTHPPSGSMGKCPASFSSSIPSDSWILGAVNPVNSSTHHPSSNINCKWASRFGIWVLLYAFPKWHQIT